MNELRRLRLNAAMSVDELAEAAGVSTKTVYNIESGRTVASGTTLMRLAEVLKVPAGDLAVALMESSVPEAA